MIVPDIKEMMTKIDQVRGRCEVLHEQIEAGLAEDRNVDVLIEEFEAAIREYEGLQEQAGAELQKMEAELKEWMESSSG